MNFLNPRRHLWFIQKSVPGFYHNSPRVWRDCGFIRARDREAAAVKACFIVGSSMVRVIAAAAIV